MLITIDPYYSIQTYNTSKEALKNNNIAFDEYMSIKSPFNWYFDLPSKPMMMNFDELNSDNRYVVSIVKPLVPQDYWTYFRRNTDKNKLLTKFIYNDCYKDLESSKFIVFNCNDHGFLLKLSKMADSKVWFLGKYINKRYTICLIKYSDQARLLIPGETILYERNINEKLETFESEFNYKVFRFRDRLKKFASTPFYDKGKFVTPRLPLEPRDRFMRVN